MDVFRTPELDTYINFQGRIRSVNSASEVVREALRLHEGQEATRAAQLFAFNAELGRRLASLDRGEFVDPAATCARLEENSAARRRDASA